MAPKKEKTVEEVYQKKSQLEHVLHRPGMYIGDIDFVSSERWVIENDKFVR
jgi:DNA topoisomerase-2